MMQGPTTPTLLEHHRPSMPHSKAATRALLDWPVAHSGRRTNMWRNARRTWPGFPPQTKRQSARPLKVVPLHDTIYSTQRRNQASVVSAVTVYLSLSWVAAGR
ncbi:hypothetical protein BJX65DRAFT_261796 [Aspergillus insuetus]